MSRRKRPPLDASVAGRLRQHLAQVGGELRSSRRRRRLTQRQLGAAIGVTQSTISVMERGLGGSLSVDAWLRAFAALDRPLTLAPARDSLEDAADAGHLAIQELVLRLARHCGLHGSVELRTSAGTSGRSADAALRNRRFNVIELVECWNTIGDIGAAARSTARKVADLERHAIATGHDRPARVGACWVVRATRRNRDLIARYPEVFARLFPGSSARWVAALTTGAEPPHEPGLVWCDVAATRLFPWRRRQG